MTGAMDVALLCIKCGGQGNVHTEILASPQYTYIDRKFTCPVCGHTDFSLEKRPNDISQ